MRIVGLGLLSAACLVSECWAKDYFLTIGGGYSPSGNQASLEKNVLFFQRILGDPESDQFRHDIYFADGLHGGADLQVMDRQSVPKVNRLMAEFFGTSQNLGLLYRNHEIPGVKLGTKPENIQRWFKEVGGEMQPGDRLCLYVTAHGNRSSDKEDPYNTTIACWNNTSIKMKELVSMLDQLEKDVTVVTVMVQCHSGGFAHFMFDQGDSGRGLASQRRVGFFATVHDRAAAGCTSEIDEANYAEYSSYFWAAVAGVDRMGQTIDRPDYNGDGVVSFDEAHAYTLLTADTIDLPIKTSGEFLRIYSRYAEDDSEPELLNKEASFDVVLELATTAERAVLEGLSQQLELSGDDRLAKARQKLQSRNSSSRGGRSRGRRPETEDSRLRREIRGDLLRKWPGLANTLNPIAVELITLRSEEFIDAVEGHPKYAEYRELADKPELSDQEKRVKYERLLRTAQNVLLAENLRRIGDAEKLEQYQALTLAESQTLGAD